MAFSCPNCQSLLDATGRHAGTSITCQCGNVVAVPKQGTSRAKRSLRIARWVVGLGFPCIVMPAIAIPNFINFGARAREAECNSNLKSLFTLLRTSDHPAPGSELTFSQLGFAPERGNRYSYLMGTGPLEDRGSAQAQGVEGARVIGTDTFRFENLRVYTLKDLPPELASQIGVSGTGPKRSFVVACVGDTDNRPDDAPDVWTVASFDRTITGEGVPAGESYHHRNDIQSD
jgi:hypothetical protein